MSPMHLVDVIDSFIKKRHELFGSEHNILALIKEEPGSSSGLEVRLLGHGSPGPAWLIH